MERPPQAHLIIIILNVVVRVRSCTFSGHASLPKKVGIDLS